MYRNFITRVAPGDDVDYVTEATVMLNHTHGVDPGFTWERGDACSLIDDAGGIVMFDTANCTSMVDSAGVVSIWMPTKVNWSWDDQADTEAVISVEDDLGVAVNRWSTESMDLVIENDIQLRRPPCLGRNRSPTVSLGLGAWRFQLEFHGKHALPRLATHAALRHLRPPNFRTERHL